MPSLSEADRQSLARIGAPGDCRGRFPPEAYRRYSAKWSVCRETRSVRNAARARPIARLHRRRRGLRAARRIHSRDVRPARPCRIRDFRPSVPKSSQNYKSKSRCCLRSEPILPENIEIGKHGLLISQGSKRGLLLPQVAVEHKLSRDQFLEETCRKAGLSANAWQEPETQESSDSLARSFRKLKVSGNNLLRMAERVSTCQSPSPVPKKRPARGVSRSGPEVSVRRVSCGYSIST